MKKTSFVFICVFLALSCRIKAQNCSDTLIVEHNKFECTTHNYNNMMVRIAEIEVYQQYLDQYLAFADEVDRISVESEPGVICLFPMQIEEEPTQIRILEIYASEDAYNNHIKTEHFQKYKQATLHMVKSLKLNDMKPLDMDTMNMIFKKY